MRRNIGKKHAQLVALHNRFEDPTALKMVREDGVSEYQKYKTLFSGHSRKPFVSRVNAEFDRLVRGGLNEYMTFPLHLLLWLYILGADREQRRLLLKGIGLEVRHIETLEGTPGYSLKKQQYPITEAIAKKLRSPNSTLRWADTFDMVTLLGVLAALGAAAYARKTQLESALVLKGLEGLDGVLLAGLYDLPLAPGVDAQPLTFCYSWENRESNTCLFCTTRARTALLLFKNVVTTAAPLDRSHTTLLDRNDMFARLFMFLAQSNQPTIALSKKVTVMYSNKFLW